MLCYVHVIGASPFPSSRGILRSSYTCEVKSAFLHLFQQCVCSPICFLCEYVYTVYGEHTKRGIRCGAKWHCYYYSYSISCCAQSQNFPKVKLKFPVAALSVQLECRRSDEITARAAGHIVVSFGIVSKL